MKLATALMNPERKELNGKVPTRQQYANWNIPVNNMYLETFLLLFISISLKVRATSKGFQHRNKFVNYLSQYI